MSVKRARALRHNATDAERKLWDALRPLRSEGYHFRRQVPIGPYYADFACHHARLIVELDGDQHGHAAGIAYDARRDNFLKTAGYTILRFPNIEVYTNLAGVSDAIFGILKYRPKSSAKAAPPPLTPPLKGEGNSAEPRRKVDQ